jgi:hypothetical protein
MVTGEELPDLPVCAVRGAIKGMNEESLKRRAQIREILGWGYWSCEIPRRRRRSMERSHHTF